MLQARHWQDKTNGRSGPGGRPTKYTPERVSLLLERIESGMSIKGACLSVGIGQSTFYDWRSQYSEFAEQVDKAVAKAEYTWVGWAVRAKDYKFLLPKRFRGDWGDKLEVSGGDQPITIRVEYSDNLIVPTTSGAARGYQSSGALQRPIERAEVGENGSGD